MRRLRQTFVFAIEGLRYAVRTQRTFRILLAIACGVSILAIWLQVDLLEAAVVVLTMVLVVAAELVNTAMEAVVDLLVGRNAHRVAKVAKDIAAGAVLVSAAAAAVVGALILGPSLAAAVGVHPQVAVWGARAAALAVIVGGAVGMIRLFLTSSQAGHTATSKTGKR